MLAFAPDVASVLAHSVGVNACAQASILNAFALNVASLTGPSSMVHASAFNVPSHASRFAIVHACASNLASLPAAPAIVDAPHALRERQRLRLDAHVPQC